MYTRELLSAVTAFGLLSGVAAIGCTDDTVQINNQGDATAAANCKTITGDVVINFAAGPNIDLGGDLTKIEGNLIANNNSLLQSLQSSSLQTIGKSFTLTSLISLTNVNFPALGSVGQIQWVTLNALPEATLGQPGITKADSVTVRDTFIQQIEGINVDSLTGLDLDNNRRLTQFTSNLKTLSDVMLINANGLNLKLDLPNLEWIANMTISNVSSINIPSLSTVNGSMRFDSNYFTTFNAPNLTQIQQGDLSFVGCPDVKNISLPQLTKVGGGLTIANNTALPKVDGLDKLEEVGGAVIIRGSFDEIDLPALNNVVGTAVFVSTSDIDESCNTLNALGTGVIQGGVKICDSNNSLANNDTSSNTDGSGSSGGDGTGAASLAGVSLSTVFTLAALGGLFVTFF